MDNIVDEFNTTTLSFIDFLKALTNDTDLGFYRRVSKKIIDTDKNKLIEQFCIHCLPHYEHVVKKNEDYFMRYDLKMDTEDNLLKAMKVQVIFPKLKKEAKNLIFEYLLILSNYAKEYFNFKYSSNHM
jgi:hypothetical protein